ncbi:MAG: hypothetical protein H6735_31680 [Alphaproteobacteria bacterium]|nr:hypothetical protein [Alphaproteobacteria bacterium]
MWKAIRSGAAGWWVAWSSTAMAHDHHRDRDHDECRDLSGDFVSSLVAGPDCASPVGMCTLGELTGDLEGVYAFTMTAMIPISDDPAETTFQFTGNSTITTDEGVIYGEDSGQLTFSGDFAFMTFVRAVDGEGCFEDVSGSLLATGNLDLITGLTSGGWEATFCGAEQCFDDDDDWHGDHHGGGGCRSR